MRSISVFILGLLAVAQATAFEYHSHFPRRHIHHPLHKRSDHTSMIESGLKKRKTCEFPNGEGMVAVAPGGENAGWAMSPDQPCLPGMYCPYACSPGQLMAQWNPKATSYSYPESMDGGLYCDENGKISKPFPDKPYCYDGVGTVSCKNRSQKPVAFCQTVLPGNEAMLIPTYVDGDAVLAVPDTSYWARTAAHYYVNPPGTSTEEGCIWGTKAKPVGNWAPYVAGANSVNGETFVTVGWNPIYIEPDVTFRDVVPDYGIRIECNGKCNGLPCEIDPNVHGVNELSQKNPPGAGGANFCVVGVSKGSSATIVVFNKDGSNSDTVVVDKPTTTEAARSTSKPAESNKVAPPRKPAATSGTATKPTSKPVNKGSDSESAGNDDTEIVTLDDNSSSSSETSSDTSDATDTSGGSSAASPSGSSPSGGRHSKTPINSLDSTSKLKNAELVKGSGSSAASTSNGMTPDQPAANSSSASSSTNLPKLALILTFAYTVLLM